jgi:hypothetical protein
LVTFLAFSQSAFETDMLRLQRLDAQIAYFTPPPS